MIKKGDIVIDPQDTRNIYTVICIRRANGASFLMHRWRDDKEFYFEQIASNGYFKVIGNIGNLDQIKDTLNIERI